MSRPFFAVVQRPCRVTLPIVLALAMLGACSALTPNTPPPPRFYALDGIQPEVPGAESVSKAARGVTRGVAQGARRPTLIVNPPHAASGYDSKHIIYVRSAHTLEYYAHSEWNDTPARMIAPLIVAALESSGSFRAVVRTPSAAAGDLRLDIEIIRLHLDMLNPPNQVQFTLRAYLVDNMSREVLAWKEFDVRVAVTRDDPYGTVLAANRAVHGALAALVDFCNESAARWPVTIPASGSALKPAPL
jgi:cholesterol transport system auxiliary component